MTSRTRRTVPLLATAALAAVGALMSLGAPAHALVPAAAPSVGYTAHDDGASCRVTFTWEHPQLGGAVGHFGPSATAQASYTC
jgi:hypothetical protein